MGIVLCEERERERERANRKRERERERAKRERERETERESFAIADRSTARERSRPFRVPNFPEFLGDFQYLPLSSADLGLQFPFTVSPLSGKNALLSQKLLWTPNTHNRILFR